MVYRQTCNRRNLPAMSLLGPKSRYLSRRMIILLHHTGAKPTLARLSQTARPSQPPHNTLYWFLAPKLVLFFQTSTFRAFAFNFWADATIDHCGWGPVIALLAIALPQNTGPEYGVLWFNLEKVPKGFELLFILEWSVKQPKKTARREKAAISTRHIATMPKGLG